MDMDVIYPSIRCLGKHPGGFSLVELLIVFALAAILLGMAAPSFSALIASNRLTGHINHLAGHLNYARSEAIKNRNNVIVCKSPDGMNCNNSSHWEEGWIIFVDDNTDRQHDSSENLIANQPPLGHDVSLTYSAFPSDNYVLYYPNGRSLGNGTFILCDKSGRASAKALVLYKTGRLRSARSMPDGSELSCPTV